ncbi:MAG: DUF4255 domain-containing protein [Bacteroidota bacterium]
MIDIALKFITDELGIYLHSRIGSGAPEVKLSKVVDESGKYIFGEETVAITVINIEEERTFKSQVPEYIFKDGQHIVSEPEIKLCLHLLFSANFSQYKEALKCLSYLLTFFQSRTCFTPLAYPSLDFRIEKLTFELQNMGYDQINQVWAFLGAKHLPSIVYKMRLVIIHDETVTGVQPPITIINENLGNK